MRFIVTFIVKQIDKLLHVFLKRGELFINNLSCKLSILQETHCHSSLQLITYPERKKDIIHAEISSVK